MLSLLIEPEYDRWTGYIFYRLSFRSDSPREPSTYLVEEALGELAYRDLVLAKRSGSQGRLAGTIGRWWARVRKDSDAPLSTVSKV